MSTSPVQNVSGVNSNSGFFFGGFKNNILSSVAVGWLAYGPGVVKVPVIGVYPDTEVIVIDSAYSFQSGQSYYFTLPVVIGPTDFIQNVAGTVSNSGYFYRGFILALVNVEVGWFAHGPGIASALVTSVNPLTEIIVIDSAFSFTPGQMYNFTPPSPFPLCFGDKSKILCLINDKEIYIPITELKIGHVVKTHKQGNRKVQHIGHKSFKNNPQDWRHCMFRCKIDPDLWLSGLHSIFVDELHESDGDYNYKKLDKYSVFAGKSHNLFTKVETTEEYTIYHFSLENDNDPLRIFAIWANGILAETTCEKEFLASGFFS